MSLTPIMNNDTDILFIPLNPAPISSETGHYFAANEIFWDSLFFSDLIAEPAEKHVHFLNNRKIYVLKILTNWADEIVFRRAFHNFNKMIFSIHDLVPDQVTSKSNEVEIKNNHHQSMVTLIMNNNPMIALILHSRVRQEFVLDYLSKNKIFNNKEYDKWKKQREELRRRIPEIGNNGPLGKILENSNTLFYSLPFPSRRNCEMDVHRKIWKDFKSFIL